jgi:hypothetical protein
VIMNITHIKLFRRCSFFVCCLEDNPLPSGLTKNEFFLYDNVNINLSSIDLFQDSQCMNRLTFICFNFIQRVVSFDEFDLDSLYSISNV